MKNMHSFQYIVFPKMSFQPIITAFLLIFILPISAGEVKNPFNLIMDKNLSSLWPKVEAHWHTGEVGSFKGVNEVKISYMIFKRPKEIGVIVISNGRTESYIKYKELVYNLNKQGYTVYVYDHRGQGSSGRMAGDEEKGYVLDFDYYVTDLKTFYDLKIAAG